MSPEMTVFKEKVQSKVQLQIRKSSRSNLDARCLPRDVPTLTMPGLDVNKYIS